MKKLAIWTLCILCTAVLIQLAFSFGRSLVKPIQQNKPFAELDSTPWTNFNSVEFIKLHR